MRYLSIITAAIFFPSLYFIKDAAWFNSLPPLNSLGNLVVGGCFYLFIYFVLIALTIVYKEIKDN